MLPSGDEQSTGRTQLSSGRGGADDTTTNAVGIAPLEHRDSGARPSMGGSGISFNDTSIDDIR